MSEQNFQTVKALVENQANLNSTAYSESWKDKGATREFHYLLAASQEMAEFINSYWLPWWSKAERDMVNCRIELVDALHFLLSEAIIQYGDNAPQVIANQYEEAQIAFETAREADPSGPSPADVIELARLVQLMLNVDVAARDEPVSFTPFFSLALAIEFPLEKLAALYMGKSTLNRFRQDRGYKQGLYKKKWDGVKEDNYFLSDWIGSLLSPPSVEQIYVWMDAQYKYHTQNDHV